MKPRTIFTVILALVIYSSCKKQDQLLTQANTQHEQTENFQLFSVQANFPETFEQGTKTSFVAGTVTLKSGSWLFTDAVIGNSTLDHKNGFKCVRIQNTGSIAMQFDVNNGVSTVKIVSAKYGSDASCNWQLLVSTNKGITWQQVGNTVNTNSTALTTTKFVIDKHGQARFMIKENNGGRLNIDDIVIDDNSSTPTRDDNMALGNPSNATSVITNLNNYFLQKTQYCLSYNNSLGESNWASWHLSSAWFGTLPRLESFKADNSLPSGFYSVDQNQYKTTGFDRGHICPSADRDQVQTDMDATYYMTNMIPQSPNNNEHTWADFEAYCRKIAGEGNELYIIAGGYGIGGTGSKGFLTSIKGKINVPSNSWKVAVILQVGSNDVGRITTTTRVIAIDVPNNQTVNQKSWDTYRTSVDALEKITGYDFLSLVPTSIQSAIESKIDNLPIQ